MCIAHLQTATREKNTKIFEIDNLCWKLECVRIRLWIQYNKSAIILPKTDRIYIENLIWIHTHAWILTKQDFSFVWFVFTLQHARNLKSCAPFCVVFFPVFHFVEYKKGLEFMSILVRLLQIVGKTFVVNNDKVINLYMRQSINFNEEHILWHVLLSVHHKNHWIIG